MLQANFARFEQIKRFTLLPRAFSKENGEITDTLKYVARLSTAFPSRDRSHVCIIYVKSLFITVSRMITIEQLKETEERKLALRRYL